MTIYDFATPTGAGLPRVHYPVGVALFRENDNGHQI